MSLSYIYIEPILHNYALIIPVILTITCKGKIGRMTTKTGYNIDKRPIGPISHLKNKVTDLKY